MISSIAQPDSALDLRRLGKPDLDLALNELPDPGELILEASHESPAGTPAPITVAMIPTVLRRVHQGGFMWAFVSHRELTMDAQVGGDAGGRGMVVEICRQGGMFERLFAPGGSETTRFIRTGWGTVLEAPECEVMSFAQATAAVTAWCIEAVVLEGLALRRARFFDRERRAGLRRG
ncbi:hypothetical protein GCM10022286_00370 [Gryllotalpicola daejeonensis]|uniref:Uncharacterized protein n=1 Tax=Gryllotalpicola daejeonensis TaxID=993087 RepID=A0ABP7ZCX2_9MICO